jgi:branched-chain amino acid transport system substrate-binding protein
MRWLSIVALLALVLASGCGRSDEDGGVGADASGGGAKAAPGITDRSIKLGGSYPFSGPASAYASIALGAQARFKAENAKGGVDGRKIEFVTLDDAYEPQRAITNVRRLVEQDQVFALFNTLGTPNNLAIWDYANQKKVPHVYVATGASAWGADIGAHPYTTGWQPDYVSEATAYAEYLKTEKPGAKVAALFQNDGFGSDLLKGFEKAIEGSDIEVVAQESYEVTDPTITSQMRKLAASGADTFLNITTPKFSAQAIATIAKSDWKPLHILNSVGASKKLVLAPVGLENAEGIVSMTYVKDPEDPQWESDAAMQEYKAGVAEHEPKADPQDTFTTYGWTAASTMIEALKAMKEPTREALMESVRTMDIEIPMLLPGIKVVMDGEQDTYPIQAVQIMRFEDGNWQLQGDVIQAGGV